MKNIFLILLIICFTQVYAQIAWENNALFEVLNLIPTKDSGCIASGGKYNNNQVKNVIKLDKTGKKEWEKQLFFGETNILLETNDGYLGSSYNDEFNTVKDSIIFKINKKGDPIYSIPNKYCSKIKLVSNKMVLIYDDSLIKFHHTDKSFLWKRKYGKIYDISVVNNTYDVLTKINNSLQYIKLDTNGNILSQKLIQNSPLMYSSLFYKKGFVSQYLLNDSYYLNYLSMNGDTIWKKIFTTKKDLYQYDYYDVKPKLNISRDYIYSFFNSDYNNAILSCFNESGKILWESKEKFTLGSKNIFETANHGVIASCSSAVSFGYRIVRYNLKDILSGTIDREQNQSFQISFNESTGYYNFLPCNQESDLNPNYAIQLMDITGKILVVKNSSQKGIAFHKTDVNCSGIYIFKVIQNGIPVASGRILMNN